MLQDIEGDIKEQSPMVTITISIKVFSSIKTAAYVIKNIYKSSK